MASIDRTKAFLFRCLVVITICFTTAFSHASPAAASGIRVYGTTYFSNKPYPGVSLILYAMPNWTVLQTTTSDSQGNYSFSGIAAGSIMVFMNAPTPEFISGGLGFSAGSSDIFKPLFLTKKISLSSPKNGAVVYSHTPQFCWNALPEAAKYTFQLNRASDWALVDFVHDITSTCFTTGKNLEEGVKYTWQVDASNSNSIEVGGTFQSFSFTLPQCQSTVTKLDMCNLQRGDILLYTGNFSPLDQALRMVGGTYWYHTAIYLGESQIAESAGPSLPPADQVRVENLTDSGWWNGGITDWAVIRPQTSSDIHNQAAAYAEAKANQTAPDILYNIDFKDKQTEDKFYCSQLVWKAYQKLGIDLEVNQGILTTLFGVVVTPDDIFYSLSNGKSVVVQESPNSNRKMRTIFRILSPGHLLLTDLQGRKTGYDSATQTVLNEIPNTYYTGPDVHPESITTLYPEEETQNWTLTVTGTATGSYTLSAELMSQTSLFSEKTIQAQTTLGQADAYPLISSELVPLIRQVFIPTVSR